jgi:hypothetical protein
MGIDLIVTPFMPKCGYELQIPKRPSLRGHQTFRKLRHVYSNPREADIGLRYPLSRLLIVRLANSGSATCRTDVLRTLYNEHPQLCVLGIGAWDAFDAVRPTMIKSAMHNHGLRSLLFFGCLNPSGYADETADLEEMWLLQIHRHRARNTIRWNSSVPLLGAMDCSEAFLAFKRTD